MGGAGILRKALLVGGAAVTMFTGANLASAQDSAAPTASPAPSVDFTEPQTAAPEGPTLDLSVREDAPVRFPTSQFDLPEVEGPRRLELELAAGGADAPVDFAIAQRAYLGSDANGDLDRQGSGSEVRIGRGLVDRRDNPTSNDSSVYMFVASENEALTWQPGARSEFGGRGDSFSLQDRVEVGDMSAGVTYERNGVQASLAYVEREESTRVGRENYSHDQSFTGVTITMRR